MNVYLYDREICPHLAINELIYQWPKSSPYTTKRKISELIQNYLKIFPKIQISSTDEPLLQDILTWLGSQGTASDWRSSNKMLYCLGATLHECTYSRAPDAPKKTTKGTLNHEVISPLFPNEIWAIIFDFVEWRVWLSLHRVSKASQQLAMSTRSGSKLIYLLNSTKYSGEEPEIITLSDLTWRRSPNDLKSIKQFIPDVESIWNEVQPQKTSPLFVPLLTARELRRFYTKLKPKNSHTGTSNSENILFYLYYLERADLFAILTTRYTSFGWPDMRSHEEVFYYEGDAVTIEVPAIRYKVEFDRGISTTSMLSLEDPATTNFKGANLYNQLKRFSFNLLEEISFSNLTVRIPFKTTMNVKICDRTLYPHLSIDELISRWPDSFTPEETKRKISELIKNYFKIFQKIQITSQDQALLQDVFTLLNDQGTASDWQNTQTMLYGQFVPFHRCTYSRVRDVAPTKTNGGLNNEIISAILPNEIWAVIFGFVDWKSWLNLHLVSKTSQRLASSTISGYKLTQHLRATKTSEDPEIIILSDFTWRRSPNELAGIKQYMPDVESVLNEKVQHQTPLPTFVPLLNAKELLRVYTKLKNKNNHTGNGVSFNYDNSSFYVYYLKQADLFAILTTRSNRAGCMGAPDTRSHEELFYYPGDVVTIEVPAIRYRVEYYRGAITTSSLVSLEDPPRTHFKCAFI